MVKKLGKSIIARIGRQRWQLHKHELIILMYHRVLPPDYPGLDKVQPGMWVHPETFREQLKILQNMYEIILLDDWVAAAVNGDPLPARACAITFDDGWHDNHDYALPVLQREQVPATIFLTTDLIDTQRHFFPERLTRLLMKLDEDNNLPSEPWLSALVRQQTWNTPDTDSQSLVDHLNLIINNAKQYSELELREKLTRAEQRIGLTDSYLPADLLDWQQIAAMAGSGLIRFGAHTRTHLRLDRDYDEQILNNEIVACKTDVMQHTGQQELLFCYPNGDIAPQAARLVEQHYPAAVTTQCGWNKAGGDLQTLRRIGISEASGTGSGFLCRLSGWV